MQYFFDTQTYIFHLKKTDFLLPVSAHLVGNYSSQLG